MNVSYLQLSILQYLNHMKMIDLPQVLVDRTQHPPFSHPTPLFSSIYTYQSTDAIRKRHLYIHISRLMQSENGILLLFYIFLSHGNGGKKWKKGVGCKKGGCCVLSTSTCGQVTIFLGLSSFSALSQFHHLILSLYVFVVCFINEINC